MYFPKFEAKPFVAFAAVSNPLLAVKAKGLPEVIPVKSNGLLEVIPRGLGAVIPRGLGLRRPLRNEVLRNDLALPARDQEVRELGEAGNSDESSPTSSRWVENTDTRQ